MLETKLPASSVSRRAGPAAAPRPVTRPARPGHMAPAIQPLPQVSPSRRPSPAPGVSRLARSETRLLGIAVICTAVVCGLLVLYLAAYARVTQLGIELSDQRVMLRVLHRQNQMLDYECASLKNAQRIIPAATKYGMVRSGLHVDYIDPRTPTSDTPNASPLTSTLAGSSPQDHVTFAENYPADRGH